MSPQQEDALALLWRALTVATVTGLFDEIFGDQDDPDTINNFCDLIEDVCEEHYEDSNY